MEKETEQTLERELREQLSSALGAADALTSLVERAGDETSLQSLCMLNKSLYRILRAVDHLSYREEEPACRRTNLDILDLCEEICREVSSLARDLDIKFRWSLPQGRVLLYADRQLVKKAILNILSNAVQAAGKGGQVRLECTRAEGQCLIQVTNSLPREVAPGPQSPLPLPPQGLGLGQELIRRVARLHDGAYVERLGAERNAALLFLPLGAGEGDSLSSPSLTGGFSPTLIEFAHLLPYTCFHPRDLE